MAENLLGFNMRWLVLTNDQQKIDYLANVLLLAGSDNLQSPREVAALEEVRKGVDAKKGMLNTARKIVENGTFRFVKAGSLADQVKNLEDMLFVALTDDDLSERETCLISEFGRLAGLNQAQIDQLTAETSNRCDSANHEITCPFCSRLASAQARFCPSCGKPFTSADSVAVQTAFDIPKTGYAVEFCESTAIGFPAALKLAQGSGNMQTAIKGKKTWYLVGFPTDQFGNMTTLASALSGMRNRRLYLDGQECNWDEFFGFLWCASQRDIAYRPSEYCFGIDDNRISPWGCKQARMEWTNWAQWFSYGRWQKIGLLRNGYVFIFDKERIRHEVATNLFRYRFCPHMCSKLVEAILRNFPDQAQVRTDGDWKYNTVYEPLPGAIKVVERTKEESFTYTSESYADGVRPAGYALLKQILRKAFDECKIHDPDLDVLLPE